MLSNKTRQVSVPSRSPSLGVCIDGFSLRKSQCNQHIQACLRREIASKRIYLQTDVHYCHWCFNWIVGTEEWKSIATHTSEIWALDAHHAKPSRSRSHN